MTLSRTAAIAAFALSTALTHGDIIFVDDDAPQGGNGASWGSAYQTLYEALATAQNGDEIRIGQGTYATISGAFVVSQSLVIRGGYAGLAGPGDPDNYNPLTFQSVLTGDVQGNDGPNFTNRADNALVVLNAASAPALDLFGLRVESAESVGLSAPNAMNATATDVVFRWNRQGAYRGITWTRCVFEENQIGLVTLGSATFADCQFRRSTVRAAELSNGAFTNCQFTENQTSAFMGAAVNVIQFATFSGCEFRDNSSQSVGGAIACLGSGLTISQCNFERNSSTEGGAVAGVVGTITACTFLDNLAAGALGAQGGAVHGDFAISDSLFVRNTCSGDGGAVYLTGGSPLINCTFADNLAVFFGGAVHAASGTSAVRNCIAWNNTAALGSQVSVGDGASLRVAFSTVEGGANGAFADDGGELLWGLGNRSTDPLFANVATYDYRLSAASPCIDAAENFVVTSQLDLAGLPRFVDTPATPDTGLGDPPIVDMGAYEFQATGPAPICDGDVNNDRVVDIQDLATLLSHFGATGGATPAQGDLNGDQVVDLTDLALLLAHFGTTCE